MSTTDARRTLYPAIEPRVAGHLKVSGTHEIYFEECGESAGKPVLFLHGGPGGGGDVRVRRFFDPGRYRIINFDQRGCGRSRPHGCVEDNTTWDLVADIERLREHLAVPRWQVFGGSWGSTLALVYTQAYPERVTELVLRGIFLLRQSELHWFYQFGASQMFPEDYADFVAPIPERERGDLLGAYHRRLTGDDPQLRLRLAKTWARWEAATSYLAPSPRLIRSLTADAAALALARLETHYFVNRGFLQCDDQILKNIARVHEIPAAIVQGRHDVVCPPRAAWELSRAWPAAQLQIVADAGHSAFEPGNVDALVRATDHFAAL
jgi:proline iminopeptidase